MKSSYRGHVYLFIVDMYIYNEIINPASANKKTLIRNPKSTQTS